MAERKFNSKKEKPLLDPPFHEIDVHGLEPSVAYDDGSRKFYPPETKNFKDKMHWTDVEVEHVLINELAVVSTVSEAIHRMSKRKGREHVRETIKDIRLNGWNGKDQIINELITDIHFANELNPTDFIIKSNDQLKKGFEIIFKVESLYFNAVLELPWNDVGPEPFDALIDVLWFRFNFNSLKMHWEEREINRKIEVRELYKNAQYDRKMMWDDEVNGGIIHKRIKELAGIDVRASFKEVASELGINYSNKEINKVVPPVSTYVTKSDLAEKAELILKNSRPSGLTKLLWKTLKWASPSEWRAHNAFNFSDMKFVESDLWDEAIADPLWKEIGDNQGRLLLPGETFTTEPLSHIKSESSNRLEQIEKEIAFNLELKGHEISLAEVVQEKQSILRKKDSKSFESIAKDFINAVSLLNIEDLIKKINNLPNNQRILVLHRLGYDLSEEQSGIDNRFGNMSIYNFYTIDQISRILFKGYHNLYYNNLKVATRLLKE